MAQTEKHGLLRFVSGIKRWLFASASAAATCGGIIAIVMVGLCAIVSYQGHRDAADCMHETFSYIALTAQRDVERNLELYKLSQPRFGGWARPVDAPRPTTT